MDLKIEKFDKKDHIFMDFFTLYGQNFIEAQMDKIKDQDDMCIPMASTPGSD